MIRRSLGAEARRMQDAAVTGCAVMFCSPAHRTARLNGDDLQMHVAIGEPMWMCALVSSAINAAFSPPQVRRDPSAA